MKRLTIQPEDYVKNPLDLFALWFKDAQDQEINDPEAACLATISADGQPSTRMILIKDYGPQGFKFHTNSESRKGRDLAANQAASLCFYWKSIRKQIRVSGTVSEASAGEADEYFAARPRAKQIGAWASQQSRSFASPDDLDKAVAVYEKKFAKTDIIPRPAYWKGYWLAPSSIEFWIAHEDRLHTRFVYERGADGQWRYDWLYP